MARRRHAGDDGFTMVELLAALTVMAIGIVGVIGVMNSSFRVAAEASAKFRATSIATESLESLRSRKYDDVVVPTDGSTVTVDRTVSGQTFEVERGITWIKQDGTIATAETGQYKQATVVVRWTDATGFHEVHQSSIFYPGGRGPQNAAETVNPIPSGSPTAPSDLIATVPSGLDGSTGVDLTWTPPSVSTPKIVRYILQYSQDRNFSTGTYSEVTTSPSTLATVLRITDLAASTTYHFRVASVAENGNTSSWVPTYDYTTPAASVVLCTVGLATVTPSAVKKRNRTEGSGIEVNPIVTVNALGACNLTTFRMVYSPRSGVTDTVVLSASGSTWTGTVVGRTQSWTTGEHLIDVYDDLNNKRATMALLVCASGRTVCG